MENLQQCKKFYQTCMKPAIQKVFPDYESRIAVGVVGEGSDCFGFDDEISKDHDYGIGLCFWLSDEDFENIAIPLQKVYEEELVRYGQQAASISLFMDGRRGVFRIGDFYSILLGIQLTEETKLSDSFWEGISEDRLATAVNGEVYRDDMGIFTKVRDALLGYYPDRVWKKRLATELYHFSQNAQSNYARMMARQDYVTADICVAQAMKSTMALVYLLNKKYAPYYKWMRRGMDGLEILPELGQILDAMARVGCQAEAWEGVGYSPYTLNMSDPLVKAFEIMAGMILSELNHQGIVKGDNPFLDIYSKRIMAEVESEA